jgi:hypothetical protein
MWPDVVTPGLPPLDREPGADPLHGNWRATAVACTRFPHFRD